MATNKQLLGKGIKYLTGALPLMFIGPSLIYNAFMNKHTNWHYLVLGIGIVACLGSMLLIFLGLKIIMKGLFND
jgi:putative Mn2+ efflux pump MntP